ncbi:hypothetical protein DQ04_07441040 [Trypanosoma grayi]|uniref:hypothetical protein n=1 Tax=Trypanosoma grayi TaxID=71804 RepID=UPI0004F402EE|nr:hypothetical protein DQ04_07441040 [Trypanosoma grayi]KEG08329.1 hypothetical protein DQ04_07441040 [Trypanosoma grayi]
MGTLVPRALPPKQRKHAVADDITKENDNIVYFFLGRSTSCILEVLRCVCGIFFGVVLPLHRATAVNMTCFLFALGLLMVQQGVACRTLVQHRKCMSPSSRHRLVGDGQVCWGAGCVANADGRLGRCAQGGRGTECVISPARGREAVTMIPLRGDL